MITLQIDNSISKIEGLSIEEFKNLRQALSYLEDNYHSRFGPTRKYLIDKKCHFPTGLLPRVSAWLGKKTYTIADLRKRPLPVKGLFTLSLPLPPYPCQTNAVAGIIERNGRGIVVAPTGLGKSYIIAMAIQALQVPTLVVVPTLELKRQLTASLSTFFGQNVIKAKSIKVQNVDALDAGAPLVGYDCVIIDEFHHSAAKTYTTLNAKAWNKVYYRIGLSATPFRSNANENMILESVISEVAYEIPYKYAVSNKLIVPMEAYYIELPKTPIDPDSNWPQVYSKLVVKNAARNEVIARLLNTLHTSKISTLCLVKEIAHGNSLSSLTGAGFANGESEDCPILIKAFNDKKLTCLIGTTGVLGEGCDTRPAEYVIIAGLGKSVTSIMQQVGRGFRAYAGKDTCKVIIFKDSSHKFTLRHFKAQCKILLDQYGIKPVKLEL